MIKISRLQVGRQVHFVLPNEQRWKLPGRHVAAIITRVLTNEGSVNLAMFLDREDYFFADAELGDLRWVVNVPYDPESKQPGTWHFMEEED